MKKLLIVLSVFALQGCMLLDAYLMKYDTNEYRIITDIRAKAERYKDECNLPVALANAQDIANTTRLFVLYAQYQPHNQPTKNASIELDKIAQGLAEQYKKSTVSGMFCQIKYGTIEHSAETMQKTIGAKPR
jgi:hypothetical protein